MLCPLHGLQQRGIRLVMFVLHFTLFQIPLSAISEASFQSLTLNRTLTSQLTSLRPDATPVAFTDAAGDAEWSCASRQPECCAATIVSSKPALHYSLPLPAREYTC